MITAVHASYSFSVCFQATRLILKTFDWWFKQSQLGIVFLADFCAIYQSKNIESHRGLIFFDRFVLFLLWIVCSGLVSSFDAINPKILSWRIQSFLILGKICCSIFWAGLLQYHMYYSEMAESHTIRISSYFAFSLWEMKCSAWKTLVIFYLKQLILKMRAGNRGEIHAVFNYSPTIVWFPQREQSTPRSTNISDPLPHQRSMVYGNEVVPL